VRPPGDLLAAAVLQTMHFLLLTYSLVWFCRLKDWVLRMIYMLVSAEEEEPWPSPFIQEDWCKTPLTTPAAVFPLDAMSRIRSGNPELQQRIFLPSKTQEVKSVPRASEHMQATRSRFRIFRQFLTTSIPPLFVVVLLPGHDARVPRIPSRVDAWITRNPAYCAAD
jgi:hypothetical protein